MKISYNYKSCVKKRNIYPKMLGYTWYQIIPSVIKIWGPYFPNPFRFDASDYVLLLFVYIDMYLYLYYLQPFRCRIMFIHSFVLGHLLPVTRKHLNNQRLIDYFLIATNWQNTFWAVCFKISKTDWEMFPLYYMQSEYTADSINHTIVCYRF